MVEYAVSLDSIFGALADPTRRDILRRVSSQQLTVSQIAESYNLSFAAVSKHLMVLQKAKLILKHRVGRRQFVRAQPQALKDAEEYLEWYRQFWNQRFDALEIYLKEDQDGRQ